MNDPESRDYLPPQQETPPQPLVAFQAQLPHGVFKIVVAHDMKTACELLSDANSEPVSLVRLLGDVL